MSEGRERLGWMYIATRKCGRVSAMCWGDPGYERSTAESVSEYIRRGDQVTRVERFRGDPIPDMICRSHEPCECRDAVPAKGE